MIIGTVKELGDGETRVALTPSGVKELVNAGHQVLVEHGAGERARISDQEYRAMGARIVSREKAWACDMMVQVNIAPPGDYRHFRNSQIIFTYFHLPSTQKRLTELLLRKNIIALACETVEQDGILPLLVPTSQVAGRMAITMGAYYLSGHKGGRGKLLAGVPGVPGANVLIIGAGNVGTNAAGMAVGMGANVTVLSRDSTKLKHLEDVHHGSIRTVTSNDYNLRLEIKDADIVVSAVLRKGEKAPKLITTDMVKSMKRGAVIIDVAIDQGGSVSTSRKTTHRNPIFEKYGVIHYCVSNMPAAYPRTATFALTNATLPYILKIANQGLIKALDNDPGLAKGVNTMDGYITYKELAKTLRMGHAYKSLKELL
ncbi:MAG: alanine dehydrogenase [DPANN group archaeon]|nr:alanine dehydrogenase [DPANN group archaeon]